ncbi:MAG: acetylxylan esterase [Bacteroidales bacterium]|nr:acetylxylan esterase [Bacteroidales bacterium]
MKIVTKISFAAALALSVAFGANAQTSKSPSAGTVDGTYFVKPAAAASTPDPEGFITRWSLLDPISKPNRTNTVFVDSYLRYYFVDTLYFKDQQTIVPKDGQKVKVGKSKLAWHSLQSTGFNVKLFRFATGISNAETPYGNVFWAVTTIHCDEDIKDVRLSVGSNSASMWWIDGKEAVLLSGDRRMVVDDCASGVVTLTKGDHIIRGVVINGPGMSDFCVRFVDLKGNVVSNYTIITK